MDNLDLRQSEAAGLPFHACAPSGCLARLATTPEGLTADEAVHRLQSHGRNELPTPPPRRPLLRFLAQLNNALIYFLLAGAALAWGLGHVIDAAVIVAVVVVNATVGFVQEGKAENALAAIRNMISPRANVMRDGRRLRVGAAEIVPGDIVLIEAGDRVPADLRLIKARGLLIDEAILTGESVAAAKDEAPVPVDAALGDRRGMAFSGTMVAAGQGAGVTVATGMDTEIGRISTLLSHVHELTTPLLRQINDFGRRFTWIAVSGAAVVLAFAVLVRNYPWPDALIAVIALAVGVVPEGLPAVITITLAIGVRRMAARNAIVRRLPAVETLGATSVICSDKTGTLTRNEMTAQRICAGRGEARAIGVGYGPDGELTFSADADDNGDKTRPTILTLVRTGLLCNDAHVHKTGATWSVNGDPMEGALVALAARAGFHPGNIRAEWSRLDEIPFDAQHRFMATLHDAPYGDKIILVKGAPERVLEMCARQADGHDEVPLDHAYWTQRIAAAAAEGERVLAFAMKPVPAAISRLSFRDVERGLVLLGIVGFVDPPREEAMAAIAECRSAGIVVKMITGDHAATAAAIARELRLGYTPHSSPRVLTGHDLDQLSDGALEKAVEHTDVFARTSPEHKLRIVQALQAKGEVVAMTGDGVNDAPSLKQADVGIAMGRKGTEAAKEASQMVLLDDNFASIVAAVHEGRTVYDNIQKVTAWTIPTNGGEVLTVILAIIAGFTLPMTPVQILWINMILTVTLGLVLAFEPPEPNVMRRPPRPAGTGLLSPFLAWRVVLVSMIFVVGALSVFFYALGRGLDVETARTMVVNTIVVLEIFYLFNVRYLHMTSFTWQGVLGTPPVLIAVSAVVAAQFAFTYLPAMQALFDTRAVDFRDGVLIVAVGVVAMAILEAEKHLMRRLGILKVYT
jgi:magnesium-transporting ATPase (P-type)